MKYAFISQEKVAYPVAVLCRVLAVSTSGYYASLRRPPSLRARRDRELVDKIRRSHLASKRRYGSPRVYADLQAEGQRVGRKRVARLMREHRLVARVRRRFRTTTDSKHAFPVAPNLLARDFTATAPDQRWVTDITFLSTQQGWLYLAVILDLFSRRVVARGFRCSMSRKGDCWDNAVAESFFATLKREMERADDLPSQAVAALSIGEYIDGFYNVRRRHSAIDYCSPIEFELLHSVKRRAA